MDIRFINALATLVVVLCWPVYLLLFLRRQGAVPRRQKQDRCSIAGIALQCVAVFLTFYKNRPLFSSVMTLGLPMSLAAPLMAIVIAIGAVWFSHLALRTLGEQWAFVASVNVKHRLIQTGAYSVVRHPLYICFFGLVFATAMVWTTPRMLPIAMGIFLVGMWIRIRTEDRLLREAFGSEFEDYARRVPAIAPFT